MKTTKFLGLAGLTIVTGLSGLLILDTSTAPPKSATIQVIETDQTAPVQAAGETPLAPATTTPSTAETPAAATVPLAQPEPELTIPPTTSDPILLPQPVFMLRKFVSYEPVAPGSVMETIYCHYVLSNGTTEIRPIGTRSSSNITLDCPGWGE